MNKSGYEPAQRNGRGFTRRIVVTAGKALAGAGLLLAAGSAAAAFRTSRSSCSTPSRSSSGGRW